MNGTPDFYALSSLDASWTLGAHLDHEGFRSNLKDIWEKISGDKYLSLKRDRTNFVRAHLLDAEESSPGERECWRIGHSEVA